MKTVNRMIKISEAKFYQVFFRDILSLFAFIHHIFGPASVGTSDQIKVPGHFRVDHIYHCRMEEKYFMNLSIHDATY